MGSNACLSQDAAGDQMRLTGTTAFQGQDYD